MGKEYFFGSKLSKTLLLFLFIVLFKNSYLVNSQNDQEKLQIELNALISNFDGQAHLYAKNLTTGEIIDINGDSTHRAASEAKLYILLLYAKQVADGALDPSSKITLLEEDRVPGSGILRFEIPGNKVSLSFLNYLMMSISDNMATNLVMREVGGRTAIESFLKSINIYDTKVESESFKGNWITTSAKSLTIAAELLLNPEKFDYPTEAVEICKQIMAKHYEDNGMARYLPWSPFTEEIKTMEEFKKYQPTYAGIELYGKAGYIPGYRGDIACFITSKSSFVIGLKCTNVDDSRPLNASNAGFEFSAEIGKLFYDHWGKE
jgi:hypothetical protein